LLTVLCLEVTADPGVTSMPSINLEGCLAVLGTVAVLVVVVLNKEQLAREIIKNKPDILFFNHINQFAK
jgi:hypothetical protein